MPSLYLRPEDSCWCPPDETLLPARLQELGLIASVLPDTQGRYPAGPDFPRLVMFLGCSPAIALDAATAAPDQAVSGVQLPLFTEPRFISAKPPPGVRCRHCRTPADIGGPCRPGRLFQCPHCGRASRFDELDWRQAAGFGRSLVQIGPVYPHEAMPSDRLLDALAETSACSWTHFFA